MNMHRVLSAIGIFPKESIGRIAEQIYEKGFFENKLAYLSIFCVRNRMNQELKQRYPKVPQITWENILEFIYNRFNKYKEQKSTHPQWDWTGQTLWRKCTIHPNITKEDFIKNILGLLRLTQHKQQRPQT